MHNDMNDNKDTHRSLKNEVSTEETLRAMEVYGGGFVKQLAALYRKGDSANRGIILAAWPDYWNKYREMAGQAKRRHAEDEDDDDRTLGEIMDDGDA